jgi:hypothetical protein
VFEREEKIGGLLRYGIPDFKMEKHHIDRRIEQMQAEGTRFRAGVEIGKDMSWQELRRRYDAVIVATGATVPRNVEVPGREANGIHFAMGERPSPLAPKISTLLFWVAEIPEQTVSALLTARVRPQSPVLRLDSSHQANDQITHHGLCNRCCLR